MEKKYFSLGISENNKLTNLVKIVFGIACIAIAVIWAIYNIKSIKADVTLWITISFLSGFGFYQLWSGFGYAVTFIELTKGKIQIKKNSMLPSVEIDADQIDKIELFPLSLVIIRKSSKNILLRFGTTYPEMVKSTKDAIVEFASSNNINLEYIEEKI
jgi:hypothetical protein